MYLVHVPLEKSLTTEYNAFVVSFCSRFEKNYFFFSRELTISNLWQNEYFMSSLCSYVCSRPSWNFDLVVILHRAPASSHVSQPPQSTQECLSTISQAPCVGMGEIRTVPLSPRPFVSRWWCHLASCTKVFHSRSSLSWDRKSVV